jgi:hypothetical protein
VLVANDQVVMSSSPAAGGSIALLAAEGGGKKRLYKNGNGNGQGQGQGRGRGRGRGGRGRGQGQGQGQGQGRGNQQDPYDKDRSCDAVTMFNKDTRTDTKAKDRAEYAERALQWYSKLLDLVSIRALEALAREAQSARVNPYTRAVVEEMVNVIKDVEDMYRERAKFLYDDAMAELNKQDFGFFVAENGYNVPLAIDMADPQTRDKLRVQLPDLFAQNKLKYGPTQLLAERMGRLASNARRDVLDFIANAEKRGVGVASRVSVKPLPTKISYLPSPEHFAMQFALDPDTNDLGIAALVVLFRIGSSEMYRPVDVMNSVDYDVTNGGGALVLAEEYDEDRMRDILRVKGSVHTAARGVTRRTTRRSLGGAATTTAARARKA